jgi:hypothetical protein
MIGQFDLFLFHTVNSWCGNWTLDRLAAFEESNQFFKGGLMVTAYWWFWFSGRSPQREATRDRIIGVLIGVFLGLALARTLAALLPFRVRPMYVDGIGYHHPSLQFPMDLESWSSFPSDMATYFFGLSFGLYGLSRPLGAFLLIFSAVWVCLPRLYLGIPLPLGPHQWRAVGRLDSLGDDNDPLEARRGIGAAHHQACHPAGAASAAGVLCCRVRTFVRDGQHL